MNKDLIINILIIILVIIVLILLVSFFVNIRTDEDTDIDLNINTNVNNDIVNNINYKKIEPGQMVFMPILNFHHIDTAPSSASKMARTYYIEPDHFEGIILELINNGYQTIFVSEIIEYFEKGIMPPENSIAITFDDGNQNFYTNAWPILQEYKIKSSMYIMTGVGGENYLNDEQIKELAQTELVEIGSHTIWHPKLTKIAKDEQLKELEISKEELEDLLSEKVEVICYPFGLYNEDIKKLSKAIGYRAGLTFDQDAWQDSDDLMELKRISVYPNLNVLSYLEKLKNSNQYGKKKRVIN